MKWETYWKHFIHTCVWITFGLPFQCLHVVFCCNDPDSPDTQLMFFFFNLLQLLSRAFKNHLNRNHTFILDTHWSRWVEWSTVFFFGGWIRHHAALHSVFQAGPDRWITAVGPTTSSLSTTISSICLQFPHSSSVSSEVHCDCFPTPPRPSPAQLSSAQHHDARTLQQCLARACKLDQSLCPPLHADTHAESHTHTCVCHFTGLQLFYPNVVSILSNGPRPLFEK